ncbi:hypothetical protein FOZ63_017136, partial [Perkinsus olseni]
MRSVVSSRDAAITAACEDVAATLYRVQRFYTDMKYYDPLAAESLAKLALKRRKSREFIRNPAEFVYITKFISLFETTLSQIVKLVDGKSQAIFIRSKQRAPASIKSRMLGLCSAVWAIGTTHELRDRREFATAVEFILTHPTLNVILPDRSVMHRLLTSTKRMNTFRVNEETQR